MSNGLLELTDNQILNPKFLDLPESQRPTEDVVPLRCWSHSGDVTVRDWPTPLPDEFAAFFDAGQCVALGPGGELGQLLGFMPAHHDLYFVFQIEEATSFELTVTVKYTDSDMNVRETSQTVTERDFIRQLLAFKQLEISIERDTMFCHFNVVNNAPEGEGIPPVYLGVFYFQVEYPEHYVGIDPRTWWLIKSFSSYFKEHPLPEEPRMYRPLPPPMYGMTPEGKMLAAQIFALERKLARLTKRLGLQEEVSGKSKPQKKPKKPPKSKAKKRSGK